MVGILVGPVWWVLNGLERASYLETVLPCRSGASAWEECLQCRGGGVDRCSCRLGRSSGRLGSTRRAQAGGHVSSRLRRSRPERVQHSGVDDVHAASF